MSDSKRTKADWGRWVKHVRPYIWGDYASSLRAWVQGEMSGGMPEPWVERWADRKGVEPVPF